MCELIWINVNKKPCRIILRWKIKCSLTLFYSLKTMRELGRMALDAVEEHPCELFVAKKALKQQLNLISAILEEN